MRFSFGSLCIAETCLFISICKQSICYKYDNHFFYELKIFVSMSTLILFVKMKLKDLLPSSTCKKCRLQIANVSFEGFFSFHVHTDKTYLFICNQNQSFCYTSPLNYSSSPWSFLGSPYNMPFLFKPNTTLMTSFLHAPNQYGM